MPNQGQKDRKAAKEAEKAKKEAAKVAKAIEAAEKATKHAIEKQKLNSAIIQAINPQAKPTESVPPQAVQVDSDEYEVIRRCTQINNYMQIADDLEGLKKQNIHPDKIEELRLLACSEAQLLANELMILAMNNNKYSYNFTAAAKLYGRTLEAIGKKLPTDDMAKLEEVIKKLHQEITSISTIEQRACHRMKLIGDLMLLAKYCADESVPLKHIHKLDMLAYQDMFDLRMGISNSYPHIDPKILHEINKLYPNTLSCMGVHISEELEKLDTQYEFNPNAPAQYHEQVKLLRNSLCIIYEELWRIHNSEVKFAGEFPLAVLRILTSNCNFIAKHPECEGLFGSFDYVVQSAVLYKETLRLLKNETQEAARPDKEEDEITFYLKQAAHCVLENRYADARDNYDKTLENPKISQNHKWASIPFLATLLRARTYLQEFDNAGAAVSQSDLDGFINSAYEGIVKAIELIKLQPAQSDKALQTQQYQQDAIVRMLEKIIQHNEDRANYEMGFIVKERRATHLENAEKGIKELNAFIGFLQEKNRKKFSDGTAFSIRKSIVLTAEKTAFELEAEQKARDELQVASTIADRHAADLSEQELQEQAAKHEKESIKHAQDAIEILQKNNTQFEPSFQESVTEKNDAALKTDKETKHNPDAASTEEEPYLQLYLSAYASFAAGIFGTANTSYEELTKDGISHKWQAIGYSGQASCIAGYASMFFKQSLNAKKECNADLEKNLLTKSLEQYEEAMKLHEKAIDRATEWLRLELKTNSLEVAQITEIRPFIEKLKMGSQATQQTLEKTVLAQFSKINSSVATREAAIAKFAKGYIAQYGQAAYKERGRAIAAKNQSHKDASANSEMEQFTKIRMIHRTVSRIAKDFENIENMLKAGNLDLGRILNGSEVNHMLNLDVLGMPGNVDVRRAYNESKEPNSSPVSAVARLRQERQKNPNTETKKPKVPPFNSVEFPQLQCGQVNLLQARNATKTSAPSKSRS